MKLASWNVNSVRAREERLLRWLGVEQPDVVCLQETKVAAAAFPTAVLHQAGYAAAVFGQKAYNGVAILSRSEPLDVVRGFGDDAEDVAARFLAARVGALRVVSLYVPNGHTVGSGKWQNKLAWLARLRAWLDRHASPQELLAVCGDWNVAPEPRDVCDPEAWADTVLFHPEARAAFERVRDWGLVDAFRLHNPDPGFYSWWDYRQLAFPRNQGLRIDHLLLSRPLAEKCRSARIDRNERKGPHPSDHVPVVVELDL